MNFLKKIKNMFNKQKDTEVVKEETPETIEEVIEEKPIILPEEMIISWEVIAPIFNLHRLSQKTENGVARQLLQNRRQERAMFESLNRIEEVTQERVTEVKEKMGIPEDNSEYELILPEVTGKDGKFQKIKQ